MYTIYKIIAFDGNVYTGKTTIIDLFVELGTGISVKEYSAYFKEENESLNCKEDEINIQRKYLLVDQKRKDFLLAHQINLLDRSFISIFAHVWARYKQGTDIRKETFQEFKSILKNKDIILPQAFIHTYCPLQVAKNRAVCNQKQASGKNTTQYLLDTTYFDSIEEFNNKIAILFPSLQINTQKPPMVNIEKIILFLNKFPFTEINEKELLLKISKALEING